MRRASHFCIFFHFYFAIQKKICNFAYVKIAQAITLFEMHVSSELRRAKGTVDNYSRALDSLMQYLEQLDVEDVGQISRQDIRGWQMALTDSGLAPNTVRQRLSAVRHWCRWMRQNGHIDSDLMAKVTPPKAPKRLPVFFKPEETEHLYDAGLFADDFTGRRDRLMLRMLYETGLRRAELASLKTADVRLGALQIKVLGKRNKHRLVPIEPELAAEIGRYLDLRDTLNPPEPYLFVNKKGFRISPDTVEYVVKKHMTALTTADRVSPHVFRHSFATHILNEGGQLLAIKELLGHSSLNATEVYTHVTRSHIQEVYNHAHPRAAKQQANNKHSLK